MHRTAAVMTPISALVAAYSKVAVRRSENVGTGYTGSEDRDVTGVSSLMALRSRLCASRVLAANRFHTSKLTVPACEGMDRSPIARARSSAEGSTFCTTSTALPMMLTHVAPNGSATPPASYPNVSSRSNANDSQESCASVAGHASTVRLPIGSARYAAPYAERSQPPDNT
jgi:hypothetical protein